MRARKNIKSGQSVSGMFVFLLLGMYALFSLLLVLIGAGVYQGIADSADHNAQRRTSLSYIASKVRAGDEAGAVTVESYEGNPMLVLSQQYEGEMLKTFIFYQPNETGEGGAICELFTVADEELDLSAGERIADVSAFDVRAEDGHVELSVTMPDGTEEAMWLQLRAQAAR